MAKRFQAFVIALLAMSNAMAADVTTDDRFSVSKDGVSVIYSWSRWLHEAPVGTPYLSFNLGKGEDSRPLSPTIEIALQSKGGLRDECKDVQWLIDETSVTPASNNTASAQLPDSGTLDMLRYVFSMDNLRMIGNAQSVQYVLCNTPVAMTEKEQESLRGVLALFDGTLTIEHSHDHAHGHGHGHEHSHDDGHHHDHH